MYGVCSFACEFLICEAFASTMLHSQLKAVAIANEMIFLGAIVVPEHLLIQVAEQVERFDGDVRSFQSALEPAPEVSRPFVCT
jgi:hypothetical protein